MQVCFCRWQICAFKRGCDTVQVVHHAFSRRTYVFISEKDTFLVTLNLGCSTKKCRGWFQVFLTGEVRRISSESTRWCFSTQSRVRFVRSRAASCQTNQNWPKEKSFSKTPTNKKDYCQMNWPQIIFWRHQPNDRNVSKGTKQFEGTTWVIGDISKMRKE